MGVRVIGQFLPKGVFKARDIFNFNVQYTAQEKTFSASQTVTYPSARVISQTDTVLDVGPGNAVNYPANSLVMIITQHADSSAYRDDVGMYELTTVASNDGNSLVTVSSIVNTYNTANARTFLIKADYYRDLTVASGVTLQPAAWNTANNTSSGVLFIAADNIIVDGTISGTARGYRGGPGGTGGGSNAGYRGESLYTGIYGARVTGTLEGAGGAGVYAGDSSGDVGGGGASAGHGTAGTRNIWFGSQWLWANGYAGNPIGDEQLTKMYMGPGGGGGSGDDDNYQSGDGGAGGAGGAIVVIVANTITVNPTGSIVSAGQNGANPYDQGAGEPGGGGAGAGGSILFKSLNTSLTINNQGTIATPGGTTSKGSVGGVGRVAIAGTLTGTSPTSTVYVPQ